ncbi:polyprenyl synthetase family protein [bacterium]|nr:polyprenyl synthetase family protein [bacterium]
MGQELVRWVVSSGGVCYICHVDLKIYSQNDFPSYLPKLNSLYDDLFSGGKGFRAKLTQMVAQELKLSENTIQLLCQTIEFIHNSSLLHDDLIDRSHLRRGKTSAWLKYTPEYAILAGDYLLARVMVNLSGFGNIKLIQLTSQAISDLIEGEWLQDDQVKKIHVTLTQMDRVHILKTGSLFQWCLRAPFLALNDSREELHLLLQKIGHILGLLLQRSDDLLDFDIRNNERKNVMGDLQAGYVNSFCAFLFLEKSFEEKTTLSQQTELDSFKHIFGREAFVEKQKSFDAINTRLIQEYEESLIQLKLYLPKEQSGLIEILQPLSKPIYWREAP